MSDSFKEQIVKRGSNKEDNIKKISIVIAIIVVFIFWLVFINILSILVLFTFCFLGKILIDRFNKEFEYIITNNELDIDVIYNKSKRKNIVAINIKDAEMITYHDNPSVQHIMGTVTKTIDCSSGIKSNDTYYIIFNNKNVKTNVVFEPNEEMLKTIGTFVNRNTFIKR